jgi:hypothetical protein
MASTTPTVPRGKGKPAKSKRTPPNNAKLLKLAAKNRPPQRWFDETTDPTVPARK